MGFILSQSATYTWPVEIKLPADGGQFTKHTFDAEFARLSQSEVEKTVAAITDGTFSDRDTCKMLLKGWRGITDTDKSDIPFSPSTLEQVVEIPTVAMSIIKSWMESLSGARVKN